MLKYCNAKENDLCILKITTTLDDGQMMVQMTRLIIHDLTKKTKKNPRAKVAIKAQIQENNQKNDREDNGDWKN